MTPSKMGKTKHLIFDSLIKNLFPFTARESAIWELEERHLKEKHQIAKQQLKDMFFLQRHHLLRRQEKVRMLMEIAMWRYTNYVVNLRTNRKQ